MRWKSRKEKGHMDANENEMDNPKKESLTSNASMSFLRDENLTFHRFTTDDSRRPSEDVATSVNPMSRNTLINSNNTDTNEREFSPTVWTTTTSSSKSNYTMDTNEFQYIPGGVHDISAKNLTLQNGSTSKLLPIDDQSNKQSKCSIFRGVLLCLCLNITYGNVVRFPRELERHGIAFLIPYITILLFIGLPIILLEVALGQFLGQGSAHSWRASPIFRGASLIGRLASWLGTIWISMQAAIAFVYIGELCLNSVPFEKCSRVDRDQNIGYYNVGKPGQECIQTTLLNPIWESASSFALLTMSLIVLWTIAAVCTYSGKTLRRTIIIIGLVSLGLLTFQTGWETSQIINEKKSTPFADTFMSFDVTTLLNSSIWFNALLQVMFSTNIGIGILPVATGKYLYKGDAVRTSLVYISFNILILSLSTVFFFTQFNNEYTRNSTISFPELKQFTSIYDNALENTDTDQARVLAGISYSITLLVSLTTIALGVYTASRFLSRHPNYVMSTTGLVVSLIAIMCPNYFIARILDTRIVGTLIICALIFDILAITWVYGAKNIYTDLEFSIGRPISKIWVFLWCIAPLKLACLLGWWAASSNELDLGYSSLPRWGPVALGVSIIFLIACFEVYRQVDYNFCSMVVGASLSSKDWGPADPIVRHAWKQWTSVCEDTGQKDFTLRRRGTRDYTHSIKRGQYSRNANPTASYTSGMKTHGHKMSMAGSNSPSYSVSGSIFGDSAIEEDISLGKHAGYQNAQHSAHAHVITNEISNGGLKPSRYSIPRRTNDTHRHTYYVKPPPPPSSSMAEKNVYNVSKINITSDGDRIGYERTNKNPMARLAENRSTSTHNNGSDHYGSFKRPLHDNVNIAPSEFSATYVINGRNEQSRWRRIPVNAYEENSTEL